LKLFLATPYILENFKEASMENLQRESLAEDKGSFTNHNFQKRYVAGPP
jgi:hypothetical protein